MLRNERIDRIDLRLINVALARQHNKAAAQIFDDLPGPYMEMVSDLLEHSQVTLNTEREWAKRILDRLLGGTFTFEENSDTEHNDDQHSEEVSS